VCEVLAGRNWLRDGEEGAQGGEESDPLNQIPLEHVLERAPRVLEEMSNLYPKLASHKFCNSLMARHHKVVLCIYCVRGDGAGVPHHTQSVCCFRLQYLALQLC
jgi:hypothetical protein